MSGDDGLYVFPANYPNHHPNAGNPHSQAGRPDIELAARAFNAEWCRRLRLGLIKAAPSGSIHVVDEDGDEESTNSDDDSSNETANHVYSVQYRDRKPMRPSKKSPSMMYVECVGDVVIIVLLTGRNV